MHESARKLKSNRQNQRVKKTGRRRMLRQLTRLAQANATVRRTTTALAAAGQLHVQKVGARWASSVVVTRDDGLPDLTITPLAAKVR